MGNRTASELFRINIFLNGHISWNLIILQMLHSVRKYYVHAFYLQNF